MIRRAPILLILALALAAAVLVGCGSGGSSTSATSPATSLTQAEFIAKADALCEAGKAKEESMRGELAKAVASARSEEGSKGTVTDATRKQLAGVLEQLAATGEADFRQIEEFGTPTEGGAQLEAFFKEATASLAGSRDYAVALLHHEDAKAQSLAEETTGKTQKTSALAHQFGFKVCGGAPN